MCSYSVGTSAISHMLIFMGHDSLWEWKTGPHKRNLVFLVVGVCKCWDNLCNYLISDKDKFIYRCLWSWTSWWLTGTRSCSGGKLLDGLNLRRRWRRRRSAGADLASPPSPSARCWSSEKPCPMVRRMRRLYTVARINCGKKHICWHSVIFVIPKQNIKMITWCFIYFFIYSQYNQLLTVFVIQSWS